MPGCLWCSQKKTYVISKGIGSNGYAGQRASNVSVESITLLKNNGDLPYENHVNHELTNIPEPSPVSNECNDVKKIEPDQKRVSETKSEGSKRVSFPTNPEVVAAQVHQNGVEEINEESTVLEKKLKIPEVKPRGILKKSDSIVEEVTENVEERDGTIQVLESEENSNINTKVDNGSEHSAGVQFLKNEEVPSQISQTENSSITENNEGNVNENNNIKEFGEESKRFPEKEDVELPPAVIETEEFSDKNVSDCVIKVKEERKKDTTTKVIDDKNISSEDDEPRISSGSSTRNPSGDSIKVQKRRSNIIPNPMQIVQDELPNYPKTVDDENLIRSAIKKNDFLMRIIKKKLMDDIIAAMYNKEISANETIIKQGDKGAHMYVSSKGKYQIIIKEKVHSEFSDNRVFGELAILYNAKRAATIKALSAGRVWVLDGNVYQNIVYRYAIKEQDEILELLLKCEKLKELRRDVLKAVANVLVKNFFQAGTKIIKQGDTGNTFYIIRAGTVTISKDGEGVVGVFGKGTCFGEKALLGEDVRQATVVANAPGVECLKLTRKQFHDYIGPLKSFNDGPQWPEPDKTPRQSNAEKEPPTKVTNKYSDINIDDLKIIKTIGVGGFGRVELVQHREKKDVIFALKYLKKVDIVMQHQQEHVYNEKNIQMRADSPFIVKMFNTYRDNKYIYFLMEACLGGDLWSLLQKQVSRRFEESKARFICACVLKAFEFLHTKDIIYRDLKPENLLINTNGYIKLTDFGFAKKMPQRGKTFTFAGTPEYVAPEIVLNRGHDKAVDYWAFGAFVFEMLTGKTPFRTDDSSHMRTYNKILSGIDNVTFPNYVTPKAKHLVEKLCRPVPSERLGMKKEGIQAVKNHPWFKDSMDWDKLEMQNILSPFKPKLKGTIDTKYFDEFKRDNDIPPDETSGWDKFF